MNEVNLILKITKYAINRNSFPLDQLITDLDLEKHDVEFVISNLVSKSNNSSNPNHLLVVDSGIIATEVGNSTGGKNFSELRKSYRLLPTAFYNYVDYLEIKEARKQANEAKKQATLALQMTVYAIAISILLGVSQMVFQIFELLLQKR